MLTDWGTVAQTIIGIVGSGFLLWQVVLTRKAVFSTQKATDAMMKANDLTEQMGISQSRAYLSVVAQNLTYDNDGWLDFSFSVLNSGQSPARDVHVSMTVTHKLKGDTKARSARIEGIGDLAAGGHKMTTTDFDFTGEVRGQFDPGGFSMFEVSVTATYNTVFKDVKGNDEFIFEAFAHDLDNLVLRPRPHHRLMRTNDRARPSKS